MSNVMIKWTRAPQGATGPMKIVELRFAWRGWRRRPWTFRYHNWGAL